MLSWLLVAFMASWFCFVFMAAGGFMACTAFMTLAKKNSELQTKCICFILYGITGLHCLHGLHSLHGLHGWHCLHFLHGWVGLHGIGLGHLQKAMQDTCNKTAGQSHWWPCWLCPGSPPGACKDWWRQTCMGWLNMHGLVKPKWNANIPCVYIKQKHWWSSLHGLHGWHGSGQLAQSVVSRWSYLSLGHC